MLKADFFQLNTGVLFVNTFLQLFMAQSKGNFKNFRIDPESQAVPRLDKKSLDE